MITKPDGNPLMWRGVDLPTETAAAQTMLMKTEQQMLYALARDYFQNKGCIVDGGCFLGGSTLPLAHGLMKNDKFRETPKEKVIRSYDLFTVEPWTIGIYFPEGTPLDTSFQHIFEKNIKDIQHLVEVNAGDVTKAEIPGEPIEILFIDLAKHWTVSDFLVTNYFPLLIPGHSIVIQQDYLYHTWVGWLHVTMEVFADYFEIVDHTDDNSVAFFYHTEIPADLLKQNTIQNLTTVEIDELQTQAVNRFSGHQRGVMKRAQQDYREILERDNWPKARDEAYWERRALLDQND